MMIFPQNNIRHFLNNIGHYLNNIRHCFYDIGYRFYEVRFNLNFKPWNLNYMAWNFYDKACGFFRVENVSPEIPCMCYGDRTKNHVMQSFAHAFQHIPNGKLCHNFAKRP